MALAVCKFGGSSLSSAEMFVRVRSILLLSPDRRYIVVSAPGKRFPEDEKITDLLYRAYEAGGAGDQSIFDRIFRRYAAIRDALVPNFDLETEFARIRALAPLSADLTVSRGEYLCAKLMAAFLDWPFVDAAGLFFFGKNGIDMDETRRRVRERLGGTVRAVIPGFYGMTECCGIRTFSRGGSDVSGALLAAALEADRYENWTDVDGLFTADPGLVPDARKHARVRLSQMESISACGARLLHPDALAPLKGSGIDTVIRSTMQPLSPGTVISERFTGDVPCVTGMRGLYLPEGAVRPGSVPLLYDTPLPGARRVACVNVFALPDEAEPELRRAVCPIHIIHMQDHKQIIIEEGDYAASVGKIHSILMEYNPI